MTTNRFKLAILESPYAGDIEANLKYARECMNRLLLSGYAPIASHLLYTQPGVLDDSIPAERELGIAAGLAWRDVVSVTVFCAGLGWSPGMNAAYASVIAEGRPYMIIDGKIPVRW